MLTEHRHHRDKFLTVPVSLTPVSSTGTWLHSTVLKCIPHFTFGKLGRPNVNSQACDNRRSSLLARNQFSMLKANKRTAPP